MQVSAVLLVTLVPGIAGLSLRSGLNDAMSLELKVGGPDDDLSFFIHDCKAATLEGWGDVVKGLRENPGETSDESKARFSFMCVPGRSPDVLKDVPKRSPDRPYLMWGYDRGWSIPTDRDDMIAVGYDLREFGNNTGPVERGITFASPRFFPQEKANLPENPNKYLLTFRGSPRKGLFGTSTVRTDLDEALKTYHFPRDDVVIEFNEESGNVKLSHVNATYHELFNTTYSLILRGHGRWSYRLSEAIGACTIPVIMSDGITLPYEELIDWSKAVIRVPEKLARADVRDLKNTKVDAHEAQDSMLNQWLQHPQDILKYLPTDSKTILKMRQEVCKNNDQYMSTMQKRALSMLMSAARFKVH